MYTHQNLAKLVQSKIFWYHRNWGHSKLAGIPPRKVRWHSGDPSKLFKVLGSGQSLWDHFWQGWKKTLKDPSMYGQFRLSKIPQNGHIQNFPPNFRGSRQVGPVQSVWYSAKKDQSKLSGIPPSGTSPNFLGSRQVGPVQTFWDPNKCDQSKLSCQLGAVQTFWFLAKFDHSKLSGRLDTRNFYGEGTGHIFISQSFVDDITELSETEKTFWELLAEKFYWLRTAKPA